MDHAKIPAMKLSTRVRSKVTAVAAGLVSLGLASSVHAADYPVEVAKRPQVLNPGMIQIKAEVVVNLSRDNAGKPINISPSVAYSPFQHFQVALKHDTIGTLMGSPVGSFGFNAGEGINVYSGPYIEAKYELPLSDKMSLAFYGGPAINYIDPFALQFRAGVGFWGNFIDNFALNANLQFGIALNERDGFARLGGRDILQLNLKPIYNITPEVAVFAETGFASDFIKFGDLWRIPLGVGGSYTLNRVMDFGANFNFPLLIAAGNNGGLDARYTGIFFNYHLDTR
jgi:hypothetical protein